MKLIALRLAPTLLTCCLFLRCLSGNAQIQQAWVAKYDNGIINGNHQALKMSLDSSGNIYVLGVSRNVNTNTGYVVIKYAPNGNPIWTGRFDSTNFPSATPAGFAVDSQGGVAVTGNAVTLKYDLNGNVLWIATNNAQAIAVDPGQNVYITGVSSNFTTMKLSASGSNIWSITDPPLYAGPANLAQAIAVDGMTNVYVCGSEIYFNEAPEGALATVAIIKYASNGSLEWKAETKNSIGGTTVKVRGLTLDGSANAYVTADAFDYDARYQTFKYNRDGSAGWYVSNPTQNDFSTSHGMALDSAGNTVVTGQAPSNFGPGNVPLFSYSTYRIDTNGNILWGGEYPQTSLNTNIATCVAIDLGNNIYVTGSSAGTNSDSDIATLKYDSNGNQIWVQRYDGPGHGNDAGNAIAVDKSGDVYVAGYETESTGFTEMVLIKYSSITLQKQSNGNFILQAYGSPGENFDIQASTNLQTWQDIGTAIADTNGFAQFADTNASNFNARFYLTEPQ